MAQQGTRTFGEKPKAFQIEDGGEQFYIGSEVRYTLFVGNFIGYIGLYVSKLSILHDLEYRPVVNQLTPATTQGTHACNIRTAPDQSIH